MALPVNPPVKPMLAKALPGFDSLPDVELVFEPKWDGFRCIVFRDGDEIELGSRNERPLTRYFPDVVEAARRELPERCVIDGELVVATPDGSGGRRLDFDNLGQRIHPAASRVNLLASELPASFVAFDLLALADRDLRAEPLGVRRRALEEALAAAGPPVHVTPVTTDRETARQWFDRFEGAGLDGVIAKPAGDPYVEDRRVQFKLKHQRTADAVVAGFRWHKDGKGVGSLLLGLYDDNGRLHHVGVCASFTAKRRVELIDELAPYRDIDLQRHPWAEWINEAAHADGRMPGGLSRWSGGKDLSWQPLRPELVVEVAYSALLAGRFRATTQFRHWRPDRDPASCRYDQLEEPVPMGLDDVLAARG
jgi:ATP-dependent DNA ligase